MSISASGATHPGDLGAQRAESIDRLYRQATAYGREFTDTATYSKLPRQLVAEDLAYGTQLNIDLFFAFLRSGQMPDAQDTAELVELALQRVRDGEPLERVLAQYRGAAEYLWSRALARADEVGTELLGHAAVPLIGYITTMVSRIANAVVAETGGQPRPHRRRGIAEALLAGRDPAGWAGEPVAHLPDTFTVAVFRLSPGHTEAAELLRKVEMSPGVYLRLDNAGWTALIADPEVLAAVIDPTPRSEATQPYWVGLATATRREQIPAAAEEAELLAELGRCLRRDKTACRRSDVPVEYALAAAGHARDSLAALVEPLGQSPMLVATLDAFVEAGFNQVAAARSLGVHRNTVTYRLTRIQELTGRDPVTPADAIALATARLAQRISRATAE
ncbi:PucR family transcriptional regulator [Nocardia asteroides]|uniref:PucR family transcriptional regulator n=1 Tax=Nocardia asteroides TaxID=1824 RepID=UPI0037CCA350